MMNNDQLDNGVLYANKHYRVYRFVNRVWYDSCQSNTKQQNRKGN